MPLKRLLLNFCFLSISTAILSGCLEELAPEDKTLFSKVYGNGGFTTAIDIAQDSSFGGYWILGAEIEEEDNDSTGTRILLLKVDDRGVQIALPDTLLMPGEGMPVKLMLHQNRRIIFGNSVYQGVTRMYRAVFSDGELPTLMVDTVAGVLEEKVNDFNFHKGQTIIATGYRRIAGQRKAIVKYYDINTLEPSNEDYILQDNGDNSGEKVIIQKVYNDFTIVANTDRATNDLLLKNIVFHVFFDDEENPQATLPWGSDANDYITGYLDTYDASNVQIVYTYGYTQKPLEANNPFVMRTNGQTAPNLINDADKLWFRPLSSGFTKYGNDGTRRIPYDMIKLENSDLLMAGVINANDNTQRTGDNIFLMRLEANCDMLWEKWLPFGGQANETLCKLKLESDGSVLMLSTIELNDNSSVISLSRIRIPLKL